MDRKPWLPLHDSWEGRLKFEAPLAPLTTFGVGGVTAILAYPESVRELSDILELSHREGLPHFILGGGSNILFSDEGFKGLVVKLGRSFAKIEQVGDRVIKAGAAALSSKVLKRACEIGLSGLEGLSGIPGTIGGAAMMNAGSFGQDLGQAVKSITWCGPDGSLVISPRANLQFCYRQLQGISTASVILELEFSLSLDLLENIRKRVQENLAVRATAQPRRTGTAGSIFKNHGARAAGRLIDECGLKGTRVGGAVVSEMHANFIVNDGRATSRDISNLMKIIIEAVAFQQGVTLKPEIKIIGPRGEVEIC